MTQDDATTVPALCELMVNIRNARAEREVAKGDVLFIAIAWIFVPAFRFFKLCPEVLWCDEISHSNNTRFLLFVFSCLTSVDKQVVFMRIWLPNQKKSSFCWVFRFVIPNLITL